MTQFKRMIFGGGLVLATLAFFLSAIMGLGSLVVFGGTVSQTVTGTANVPGTCYISLNALSITFAPLSPTQNTITMSNAILDTDNGGNIAATILIYGGAGGGAATGNWVGITSGDTNTIGITNTVYSNAGATLYGAATGITSSALSTSITVPAPTQASPSQSATVYLGMGIPAAQHADIYTTNIVIENSC